MRNAPSPHTDASGHGHTGAGRGDLGERPDCGADARGAAVPDGCASEGTEHGRRTTGVRHLTPPHAAVPRLAPPRTVEGRAGAGELPWQEPRLTGYLTGR